MSMEGKNILITGISGFIGSNLGRFLVDQGAQVFGLMRRRADGSIPQNIREKDLADNITLIEGSLEDFSGLKTAMDIAQPDYIYHMGAISFIPRSFTHPNETTMVNTLGTSNLLEAVRLSTHDPKIIFPGTAEEYGLVICSEKQYQRLKERYGSIFPEPVSIPELPVKETNPLRPVSPYGVSKVYGDFLMRNYHYCYGMDTVVSRAMNTEGAGRGIMFVTSVVTRQVAGLKAGAQDHIAIGNVNAFRSWTHVMDVIRGYCLLGEKGVGGEVYNQGAMRTTSVLSYILWSLEVAGYPVDRIETFKGDKKVKNPTEIDKSPIWGVAFEKTITDQMMLNEELEFDLSDRGIYVHSGRKKIPILFDAERFRLAEVPVLFPDSTKVMNIGFKSTYSIKDIIDEQLQYFTAKEFQK